MGLMLAAGTVTSGPASELRLLLIDISFCAGELESSSANHCKYNHTHIGATFRLSRSLVANNFKLKVNRDKIF